MSWVVPGLLYAFFNSVVIFVNEKFKRQPSFLGMYRGFGSMAVALPFVFWVAPPTDVWFWVFACLQGIMVGFFDYRLFASSARYGAGGTSMMTVLAIVLTIVLWWLIDLNRLFALLHDPLVFLGILLSLAGCVGGYLRLAGSQLSKNLLHYMAPAILALALMSLNSKNIVSRGTLEQTTLYYIVAIGGVGGLFNAGIYACVDRARDKGRFWQLIFSHRNLQGGLLMLLCSVLLMVTKNIAMKSIPNPGFLNTLALTSPLWVLLINQAEGIHTRISVSAAIFTLACIALLVYVSGLPLSAGAYY